jgi:hypothetical protein
MNKAAEIIELIKDLSFDIRAEVLMADLIENGLSADEFVVIPAGTLKRKYSTDIRKAEVLKATPGKPVLVIQVNRDGIYDALPEGLFHSPPEKPMKGASEMSLESKKLKREEKEARNFFLPFENEVFLHHISLELAERRILRQFSQNLFDEISPEFWNFDKTLHPEYISKLILLLHHAHKIAGNFELTRLSLEMVLEEKVNIKVHPSGKVSEKKETKHGLNGSCLGNVRLGMDFICDEHFTDLMPVLEVQIGPITKTPVTDYIGSGKLSGFLHCFYNYFIPAGMEVDTLVIPPEDQYSFILDESKSAGILGYNTAV